MHVAKLLSRKGFPLSTNSGAAWSAPFAILLHWEFDNHFHLCQSDRWKITSHCNVHFHLLNCQLSECLYVYTVHLCFFLFVFFVHLTNRLWSAQGLCIFRILFDIHFSWLIVYLLTLFEASWLVRNVIDLYDPRKDSDAGRDRGQEEKGMTEGEMAGWHHRLHGRESGWTPGVGDGQGGLACCDSWGRKESDITELNWVIPENPQRDRNSRERQERVGKVVCKITCRKSSSGLVSG